MDTETSTVKWHGEITISNGHLDLYITKNGSPNKLFHNHGTGLFSEVAAQVGLDHNGSGDCNWLDFDADGDLDEFQIKSDSIWMFRNDSGSFVEVAASLGLSSVGSYKASVWFDYDGDEDLDLFLSSKNSSNKLFQQQVNGTFSEVASAAGVASGSNAMEVSVCDYDGDGWPDLIISGRSSAKRLMRNNGDGTFTNGLPPRESGRPRTVTVAIGRITTGTAISIFMWPTGPRPTSTSETTGMVHSPNLHLRWGWPRRVTLPKYRMEITMETETRIFIL